MAQPRILTLWHPEPNDPMGDIEIVEFEAPPQGYEANGDPFFVDRYEAEQLTFSVAQFYDTAWPIEAEPLAA